VGDAIVQYVLWTPLTAFAATLLVNWWLARSRFATLTLDHPNRRSLHDKPVPRTGGIGMHAGILLALAIIAPALPPSLLPVMGILIAVSLVNDVREIPAAWRLLVHLVTAAVFCADVLAEYGLAVKIVAALGFAWMANLYNFMDGSDGLAGGMALFGFSFYGVAAAVSGSLDFAMLHFSIAAAAAAFLVFNFHPARIFLGDAGSVPLGFLAAALGTIGWLRQDWPWWFPLLVFLPFIADTSVTLARRLAAGDRVWHAHREHYYQRLVLLGWGHRRTALAEYGLMLACGLLGLVALAAPAHLQIALLAAACVAHVALMAAVHRAWRKRSAGTGQ
jgi:UDP-N-acetylmuramyl pentapeptide phosphotransferase/UDP-N-acetylglucosamine-1-phosphate transferase